MFLTLFHPQVIQAFIVWFLFEKPISIIKNSLAYMRATADIFSFSFLLKTLFVPWKNMIRDYPQKGFNPQLVMQILFDNMIARSVGAVVRIFTIFTGIMIELMILIFALIYVVLWYTFPVLLFFGLIYTLGYGSILQ